MAKDPEWGTPWTYDVDALRDTRDPDILRLSDQDVQPGADTEHVDVFVRLFQTDRTGSFGLVPPGSPIRIDHQPRA